MKVSVVYSSTALVRQLCLCHLISEEFLKQHSSGDKVSVKDVAQWLEKETSIVATPHAQRSVADVEVVLKPGTQMQPLQLIDDLERVLGTPVQSAVKRQDEQEFARLNASHLMFCEDAGRKVQALLKNQPEIIDYRAKLSHKESLHPHDAVCFISKN
ncbi:MAG: GTP cyclohydrolase, FolE2/MptA family [Bdellovibrionales bacterium]